MNIREIIDMKGKERENFKSIEKEYREWMNQINFFPQKVLLLFIVISVVLLYFFYNIYWVKVSLSLVVILSVLRLLRYEGHREGYFDGYYNGFDEGMNRALGIGKEDEEFIAKVEIDQSLEKFHKD